MSDPGAQAAAQIAADAAPSSTEPSMLDRAMETIHTLEAKVEHLIHPDAPGNVVAGAADSAAAASASTAETSPASMTSITPEPSSGEAPNAVATPPAGAAMPASTGNVLLNAAPVVDEGNVQSAATASSPLPNSTPSAPSSPERSTENSDLSELSRESHLMLLEAKIAAFRMKLANAERVALVEFEAIVGHIKAVL
jgi:hypothetical protein